MTLRCSWWALACVALGLGGCQTPGDWSAWLQPSSSGTGNYGVAHSPPRTQTASWLKPQPKSDDSWLLKYATDQDNANRANPNDRDALRQARLGYERILLTEPSHAYVLHRLGTVADREGRFREAEQYYRSAQQLTPNNADLLSDMGYSYLLQDRLQDSEQLLRQSLQINSRQPKARVNLGLVYAQLGRSNEAYDLIRTEKGDAEARQLIAQYSRGPEQQDPLPPVQPGRAAAQPPANASLDRDPQPHGVNEATRKLAEEMVRQRQLRAQQEGQGDGSREQPRLTAPSPWTDRSTASRAVQTGWESQAATAQPTGEVPPEHLNRALSNIDRQYDARSQQVRRLDQSSLAHSRQPADPWAQPRSTAGPPANSADPAANQANWEQARALAAQMGFEAGGGTLFATEQPESAPAGHAADPRLARGPAQSRRADAPIQPAALPPAAWQPGYTDAHAENQAELELLNDQVRQLQEQISQKRAEWDRTRTQPANQGRPGVELLTPSGQ